MPDYEQRMLELLVKSYRDSKKDSGTNRIHKRTQLSPLKLYKGYNQNDGDMEEIEAVNQAAEACRQKGFLTVEMNGFSNEISRIYLVDERVDEVEQYLKENYQRETKQDKMRYVEQMITQYGGRSPAAELECEKLRTALERNFVPQKYLQIEDVLKALVFIENNQQTLYIREASMLIYGSSKYLEENTLDKVCRLLRAYLKRPCEEDELQDEILSVYGIIKEKQKLCLKGKLTMIKSGEKIELGLFPGGVEFYAEEREQIARITVHTPKLVTVENRTAYLRCQAQDTSFFYLGGYANRFQRDFLKRIYRDNPGIAYWHFGDIDAGGFFIHEHLCSATGIPFRLYKMSVEQLQDERYRPCLQKLTANDRKRLRTLTGQYREVAEYMLAHGVKLEQEIISYYDPVQEGKE